MLKSIKVLFFAMFIGLGLASCNKELSEENGLLPGGGGGVSGSAVFSFDGAPGGCVAPVINGTYTAGTALGASNTVELDVTVTTAGTYTITTSTSNGISFTGSGTFASAGPQTVTLSGSGTPTTAGTAAFTPGSTGCTFTVTIVAGSGGGGGGNFLKCKVAGTLTDFSTMAEARRVSVDSFSIGGITSGLIPEVFEIQIVGTDPIVAGTYMEEGGIAGAPLYVIAGYVDALSASIWYIDNTAPTPRALPFTVNVTNITATRIEGTFQGGMYDAFSGSTTEKRFTEGTFSLPIN